MARLEDMFFGLTWWKWLVLLLIPYIILMGFLVPLGQGITSTSPATLSTNKVNTVTITGYNTKFENASRIKAWLKSGELVLPSTNTLIKSPQEIDFQFLIPAIDSSNSAFVDLSLIVNTERGPIVLPSAFILKNLKDTNFRSMDKGWSDQALDINAETNFNYPFRNLMGETIRNTFFHVPLWFAMTLLFMISGFYSIRSLRKGGDPNDDKKVVSLVATGVLFGILGIVTGMLWAKYTWGQYWSFDVKQNMAAIALVIYLGYFLLQQSLSDPDAQSRIGNIYNIFAFCLLIPLIFIIPRRYDSLHPGNGGNPAMGGEDLDNTMRVVFYPAVLAYILLGLWLSNLYFRFSKIKSKSENHV